MGVSSDKIYPGAFTILSMALALNKNSIRNIILNNKNTLFPRCVKCTKTEKFIGKGASSLVAWL
jgi:hypothetical protein